MGDVDPAPGILGESMGVAEGDPSGRPEPVVLAPPSMAPLTDDDLTGLLDPTPERTTRIDPDDRRRHAGCQGSH